MTNIFSLVLDDNNKRKGKADRSVLYGLAGFMLGISAPIGWLFVRMLFFYQTGATLWSQSIGHFLMDNEHIVLVIYMGAGTAAVLGTFGFFIGRAAEQIHSRAERLNEMNKTVAKQKEFSEKKYKELNARISNFHAISARLQKTTDLKELIALIGNGLREVMVFDRVNILTADHEQKLLRMSGSFGCGDANGTGVSMPLDTRAGVIFKAVMEKHTYLVDDITLMPADFRLLPPCDKLSALRSRHFLVCPVIVNNTTEMVLAVDNKTSGRKLGADDVETIKLFAAQLSGSITRLRLFSAVETMGQELTHTFSQIMQYRQDYQVLLKTLKRATGSTVRLVDDIVNSTDVVRDAVSSTQSAATEISASIDHVGNSILQLSEFMDKSISAMTEIAATIKEVDDNSISSHKMTEQVKIKAEDGVISVRETLSGLAGITSGVADAARTIDQLSQKGVEVSTITTVISEIAQKTNLLALNAAIIAAQAGEHGRSFAVVAEEIRGLSQKTAHSSAAIAQLIRDIQKNTSSVVAQIRNAQKLVTQGVTLGQNTEGALGQILTTATSAMDMARSIRLATREVSKSAEFVTQSIEELGEMTEQVSTASREQAIGTHGIVRSIEDIRDMADEVATVAIQQRQDSRDIEMAVESVAEMANRIFAEMEARSTQSQRVTVQLKQFCETD